MDFLDGGAGMPDAWQRLWAPHRLEYIRGENRPLATNDVPCPFCDIPSKSDEDALIVHRGTEAYVVMNLYPYNPGHLLVKGHGLFQYVLFKHIGKKCLYLNFGWNIRSLVDPAFINDPWHDNSALIKNYPATFAFSPRLVSY